MISFNLRNNIIASAFIAFGSLLSTSAMALRLKTAILSMKSSG